MLAILGYITQAKVLRAGPFVTVCLVLNVSKSWDSFSERKEVERENERAKRPDTLCGHREHDMSRASH